MSAMSKRESDEVYQRRCYGTVVKENAAQAPGWAKAQMHFELAKAAMKLAARDEHGAAMAIEYLEKVVASLKAIQCPRPLGSAS